MLEEREEKYIPFLHTTKADRQRQRRGETRTLTAACQQSLTKREKRMRKNSRGSEHSISSVSSDGVPVNCASSWLRCDAQWKARWYVPLAR